MEGVKIESMPATPATSSEGRKSDRKSSQQDSEGAMSTAGSTPVKSVDSQVKEGMKSVDLEGREGTPSVVGGSSIPGLFHPAL